MKAFTKRGLSPVIATTLLVAISLVLAMIIFLWAKGVVGEAIEKDGVAIEIKCEDIVFTADITEDPSNPSGFGLISIQNDGNIPLYGVDVKKVGAGTIGSKSIFEHTIPNGDSIVDIELEDIEVISGDEFTVIPIIVGTSDAGNKQYPCVNKGQSVTAIG